MKTVLIAIRPKWCEKIAKGEKTIDVRKSAPKEVPFKAYIYCAKEKPFIQKIRFGDIAISHTQISNNLYNGKVIGDFICDKVERLEYEEKYLRGITSQTAIKYFRTKIKMTALSVDEIMNYGKGKALYGWHISDLKIYDKPRELSEFKTPPCEKGEKACANCKWLVMVNTPDRYECECYVEYGRQITRPPQSYMFVEDLGEVK